MTHPPTTVLIAEDDPVFRRVMSFSIAKTGLTVESVGDGLSAYERLCKGGIDFLITDHQMPICSGLELLDRLAVNPQLPAPPTILCTAKGLELDRQGLLSRYHLVAIMHKPFSPRKLVDLILQHVPDGHLHKNPKLAWDIPTAKFLPPTNALGPQSNALGNG